RHTISKRDWSSDVCSSDLFSIFMLKKGGSGFFPATPYIVEPKMSDTSKKSAEDISEQLAQIKTYVSIMTEMVDHVSDSVHKNSESVDELRNAYEQIMNTAEKLSTVIQ